MKMVKSTVTLSLPDTPDVHRLRDMYEEAVKRNSLLERNIGGVIFDQNFYNTITSTFPDDSSVIAAAHKYVQNILGEAMWRLGRITDLRHQASISGAMRWPWSQEARINDELRYD